MDGLIQFFKTKPGVALMGFGMALALASLGVELGFGIKVDVGDKNGVMWAGVCFAIVGLIYNSTQSAFAAMDRRSAVELKKANIAAGRPDADPTIIRSLMGEDDD